jgi:hypothetical protein
MGALVSSSGTLYGVTQYGGSPDNGRSSKSPSH